MTTFISFIITPVVGGVIGYTTNWIAIKMLFRPYNKKKIFNITVPFTPGLIPKERHKLANKVGETIGEHLLTTEVIIKTLTSDKFKRDIKKLIDDAYDKLKSNNYTVEQIVELLLKEDKEKVVTQIKNLITQKLDVMLKDKTQIISDKLQNEIKIFAQSHISEMINLFIQILDIEDVNKFLRQILTKIIKNALGSIASVFVNTDKIFDNIIVSIKEFCADEQNYNTIVEQLNIFIDYMTNKRLNEKTTDIVTNIINKNIYSLADYFFKMEINTMLDKKIEKKMFDQIKNNIISKYEVFIIKIAPYIITTLDIPQIVEDRINDFKMEQTEQIIISVVKKELNAITWLGALLGFIIGLIPVILRYFNLS